MSTESRELPELVARWERQIKFACGKKDRMNDAQRTTMQECLDDLKAALANSRAQDSGGEAVAWECRLLRDGARWEACTKEQYDSIRLTGHYNGPCGAQCEARSLCVAAEQPAKGDVPLCEKYGDGCNFPDCPCDVDDPLTQQPFKGECFADALDEDIQEARTPQPSDPADAELATLRQWVRDNMPPSYADTPLIECMAAMMECGIEAELEAMGNAPPTAQRHDVPGKSLPADEDGLPIYPAHGAGAAVEAVAVLPITMDANKEALGRILDYADELKRRDYRSALASWNAEHDQLMARRPIPESAALSTQPLLSDQPAGVSNAMVERCCVAAYNACDMGNFPQEAIEPDGDRRFVRAVLEEAALNPEQAKDGAAG